jgi:hypothetical protein
MLRSTRPQANAARYLQIMLLHHNHFLWLSFTRFVCSARKQEVAVPELIYLDRADEQIDCRNDAEQDEEGEIVQLVVRHSLPLACLECELLMLLPRLAIPRPRTQPRSAAGTFTPPPSTPHVGLRQSVFLRQVERKFPTRRPHKRKRESSEESMETDMDMSDDDCTHHHLRNAAYFANAVPFPNNSFSSSTRTAATATAIRLLRRVWISVWL